MMKDETNENVLSVDDESPKPTKITSPHESTNILLGTLCGHVQNLVTESNRANRSASLRHDDWQQTLEDMGQIQAKAQKSGAKIIMVGICIMSTIISAVVSLLI